MTRRSLFPALAAGLLAPRCAGAVPPCVANFEYPDNFDRSMFQGAEKWQCPKRHPRPRKLWSKMRPDEKATALRTIARAYKQIAPLPQSPDRRLLARTWMGQGWLHSYICANSDNDGLGNVHNTSAFLAWHRAFLYFHEQLLQTIDPKFVLPVWDWENCNDVPHAYENWVRPPSPPGTNCLLQRPKVPVKIDQCILQSWLLSADAEQFLGPQAPGTPGDAFGGPHQLIHTSVGPFMNVPYYAALDPLFYAHHANMDRFYCAWWKFYKTQGFDPSNLWQDVTWYFYDARTQKPVWVNSKEFANLYLEDIESLGYYYPQPAQVTLYKFFSIISEAVATAVKLSTAYVKTFLLALQAAMAGKALETAAHNLLTEAEKLAKENIQKSLKDLEADIAGLLDLFDQTVEKLNVAFPVRAVIDLPVSVSLGKYYAVGLKTPDSNTVTALGGFGVFTHMAGHGFLTPVSLCIRKEVFRSLIKYAEQGSATVVYGNLSADGQTIDNPTPVKSVREFEIRYPQNLSILLA
jgi:hypothetical protein